MFPGNHGARLSAAYEVVCVVSQAARFVFICIAALFAFALSSGIASAASTCPAAGGEGEPYNDVMIMVKVNSGSTTCNTNWAYSSHYSNPASIFSNYTFGLMLPDSSPVNGSTNPAKIFFSDGSSGLSITSLTCPGGSTTGVGTPVGTISLDDGDSCTISASANSGADTFSGATLSRSGNIYSITSGSQSAGPPPLTTTQAVPSTTVDVNATTTAIPFTPVTASGGATPYTFAVSPSLPAGLSFNTSTGQITGTPTAGQATTTHTVTVTDSTSGTAQTSSKTFDLTVNKMNQTITFPALPDAYYGKIFTGYTETQNVMALGTSGTQVVGTIDASANSSLPLVFTTSGPCSYNSYYAGGSIGSIYQLTFTGVGSCTVTAKQGGNATYNSASDVIRSFNITKGDQTIRYSGHGFASSGWNNQTYSSGGTFKVYSVSTVADGTNPDAVGSSSQLPVGYTSTTPAVCSVGSTEIYTYNQIYFSRADVSMNAPGACTLDLAQPGDANFNVATTIQRTVTIDPPALTTTQAVASSTLTVDVAATTFTPITASGGVTPLAFAITPALPTGLSFNTSTGEITGTPTAAQTATTHTVTVTDSTSGTPQVSSKAFDLTINKGTQASLTASVNPNPVVMGSTSALTTTGGSGTGAVSYAVTAGSSNCSVSGSTLTGDGIGSCTVTATKAADANYNQTTATVGVTVDKANQTITFPAIADSNYGKIYTGPFEGQHILVMGNTGSNVLGLGANASSGLELSFTTTGSCEYIRYWSGGANGAVYRLNFTGPGTCSVTAKQAGNVSYNVAPDVTRTFNIAKGEQAVIFDSLPAQTYSSGGTFGIQSVAVTNGEASYQVVGASSQLMVSYTSKTPSICTVGASTLNPYNAGAGKIYYYSNANVTMVAPGACTITGTQAGDANFNAASDKDQNFTINPPALTTTQAMASSTLTVDVAVSGFIPVIASGGVTPLAFAITPALPAGLLFSTTTGEITGTPTAAQTVRTHTVTVTDATPGTPQTSSKTFNLTVNKGAQAAFSVTANPNPVSVGSTATLSASGGSGTGTVANIVTDGGAHCSIGASTLSGDSVGTCTVTATKAADANYNATNATVTVTVNKGDQTITFAGPTDRTYSPGGTVPLSATGGASGEPISFASNTTGVCTVSGTTAMIVSVGTCSITASQAGNANYNAAPDVTRTFNVTKANQTITASASPNFIQYNGTSTVSSSGGSGTGAVTYAVTSGDSFCSVTGTTVTGTGIGSCTVTATKAADANYNQATSSAIIHVAKADQTITASASPASIAYNGTSTVSSSGGAGTGAVTYAVTSGASFCLISGTTVTGTSVGTCTVTATKAADANYNQATATANIAVGKADQAPLAASASPGTIDFGGTSTISSSGGSGTGATTYSVTAGTSFCSISGMTITATGVGTCTVTATKAADANYREATATTDITINKADQAPLNVSASPNPVGFGGSSTLTTSGGSGTGAVTYSVTAGGTNCSVTGSTLSGTGVGICTVSATKVADANYNQATATISVTVSDTVKPVIAAIADKTVTTDAGKSTVSVSFSTTVSDNVDPSGNFTPVFNIGSNVITSPHDFPIGSTTVTITANADTAGNVPDAVTFTVTVTDNEAPKFTGFPADITINVDFPNTSAIATWSKPGAMDNAPGTVINQIAGLSSGSSFPLGTTTNTFEATDASGNKVTQSFTVTVNQAPPGSVTFLVNSPGGGTFDFTSAEKALNFSVDATGGNGTSGAISIRPGNFNVAFTAPSGVGISSASCTGTSTLDTTTMSGTVNLASSGTVTCTVNALDSVSESTSTIGNFLEMRANLVTQLAPSVGRRLNRISGNYSGGTVSGFGFTLSHPELPVSAQVSRDALSFSWSLQNARSGMGAASFSGDPTAFFSAIGIPRNDNPAPARFTPDTDPWSGAGNPGAEQSFAGVAEQSATLSDRMALGVAEEEQSIDPMNYRFDVWLEGKVARFDAAGSDGDFIVLHGGIDYLVNPNLLIGISAQADWVNSDLGTVGSTDGRGFMVGPYMTSRLAEGFHLDARVAWGRSSNDTSPFGTYRDTYESERWLASLALMGEMKTPAFNVRPRIAVNWYREVTEAYVDSLSVLIPSVEIETGTLEFGPTISTTMPWDEGQFTPFVTAEGIWTFMQENTATSVSNQPGATDTGIRARLEAGFDLARQNGTTITAATFFDGLGDNNYQAYGGRLALRKRF